MASVSRKLPSKLYAIQAHSSKVTCLDIGETGRVLVTGGQDRNIKLWTFGDEKCFMTLPGHNSPIDCVKFAYSDDFVYSADDTGVIKRWNLNASDSISLFGHMKSVRTLDFYPYSDSYLVSGSNDTSIRLWDVREKVCIKRYRGHMSHVNSVKFSPDGSWIASAGAEGSVIIWDIRMSKLFMEFTERQTPATCVKYHPTDLLMAAGRSDGTVDLYDLEKRQLITQTHALHVPGAAAGQPVRYITFDESGKCLFVGTGAGITVVGWEPDREYDRIESNWCQLGDMKIAGSKLLFGTYEEASVAIHAVPLGQLRAFYNPQSQAHSFTHNQSSRKSFSRGSGKVRLSIGGGGSSTRGGVGFVSDAGQDGETGSGNGGGMSPNLNIEKIDEEDVTCGSVFEFDVPPAKSTLDKVGSGRLVIAGPFPAGPVDKVILSSADSLENNHYHVRKEMQMYNLTNVDYYPLPKGIVPEVEKEDFPVNNVQPPDYAPKSASQPLSGGSSSTSINGNADGTGSTSSTGKSSATGTNGRTSSVRSIAGIALDQRRPGSIHGGVGHSRSAGNLIRRLATSKSTLELNKLSADDAVTFKKPISRGSSPIRHQSHQPPYYSSCTGSSSNKIQRSESSAQIASLRNGTSGGPDRSTRQHNANVKVQIVTKPVRSKTSLDIRHHGQRNAMSGPTSGMYGQRVAASINPNAQEEVLTDYRSNSNMGVLMLDQPGHGPPILRYDNSSIEYEIQMLRNEHDTTLQTLCNRSALLSAIRNYTKSGDVTGALKVAVRMNDQHILVDVLGAILEKTSQWNLDMCVLLLPKVYDLLQSEYKFHCTRACDTLRVILSTFLPVIRENTDAWGACTIGVDVSREERQSKCLECKNWLLRIRSLPENSKAGSSLQQLQNMIVDI
ncbi:katanin p80 WD40 repeat-containing subunit B1 [Anopheles maculipalpis]|uniref:katanin p80 WD40 repeat-containing subunit B1 n=1 Tax=Anopheles maculipalpis TaxID=1496333 RepID=UPI002158F4EE|nr:katanin p80 WD40 repeat-containing subunit B1 [Anopheles maculipalpis]